MPLGTDDRKSAGLLDLRGQLDVGASAGHVGSDGNSGGLTRLGDYLGLTRVLLGIEDIVPDAPDAEHTAQQF